MNNLNPAQCSYTRLLLGVSVLCLLWLGMSCTQERQPCLTPKISSLNIECVHYPNDSATTTLDTAFPKAIFIALTPGGAKGVIYQPTANFTLSLSSVADSCQWLMAPDSALVTAFPDIYPYDTLNFFYRRKLQFLSNACGYTYFYSLDSVHYSRVSIDSILITNTSVTNDVNIKHLKIFIKRS